MAFKYLVFQVQELSTVSIEQRNVEASSPLRFQVVDQLPVKLEEPEIVNNNINNQMEVEEQKNLNINNENNNINEMKKGSNVNNNSNREKALAEYADLYQRDVLQPKNMLELYSDMITYYYTYSAEVTQQLLKPAFLKVLDFFRRGSSQSVRNNINLLIENYLLENNVPSSWANALADSLLGELKQRKQSSSSVVKPESMFVIAKRLNCWGTG
jgi:hypothetical protein